MMKDQVSPRQVARLLRIDKWYRSRGRTGISEAFQIFLDAVSPDELIEGIPIEVQDDTRTIAMPALVLDAALRAEKDAPSTIRVRLLTTKQPMVVPAEQKETRALQAGLLWELGWGRSLGYKNVRDYVSSIPPCPPFTQRKPDPRLDRVVLVDARVPVIDMCRMLDVGIDGADDMAASAIDDTRVHRDEVYWITCQDGRWQRGKTASECLLSLPKNEIGMTLAEGLSLYAQYAGGAFEAKYLRMIGSTCGFGDRLAFPRLGLPPRNTAASPLLEWDWGMNDSPDIGNATRLA